MKRLVLVVGVLLLAGCGWFNPVSSHSGPARLKSSAGNCSLSISGIGHSPLLSAQLPDGALIVGSAQRRGSKLVVSLRRVSPDCQFYDLPRASVPVGKFGTIDTMVATPQADLILGGTDGKQALVGRLMATGRPDQTFGSHGWVRFSPHEQHISGMPPATFEVTSVALSPSSSIVLGLNDGGPHCCALDFVTELTPAGNLIRTTRIPVGGSYTTEVSANRDGSVYALAEYEQSGCGGPSIFRIGRDGKVDAQFASTIQRTVKRIVVAKNLRFTPSLVPAGSGGAFLLVGGLDRTCVPAAQYGKSASGGVSVAVNASGQMSRAPTRFASPGFAFDNPTTVRLASGVVFAAAVQWTANGGRPKDVLVQSFAADGSPAARTALPLPNVGLGVSPNIALFPGGPGYVRLVIGTPTEIDVTSVPIAG